MEITQPYCIFHRKVHGSSDWEEDCFTVEVPIKD